MTEGTTLTPRLTNYRGTPMRSRLEARYAAWLDRSKVVWQYEPQCFAGEGGQYLPDFRLNDILILGSPRTLYVDVKPTFGGADDVLDRMTVIWESEPDAFLAVDAPPRLGSNSGEGDVGYRFPPALHVPLTQLGLWARYAPTWQLAIVKNPTFKRWDWKVG